MLKKDKSARDEFTLSLGGIKTITTFTSAPAIAHDRLRQDSSSQACDTGEQKKRLWMPRRFRVA
jgi:hypothetical protein